MNPFRIEIGTVIPELQLEVLDLQNDRFIKEECRDLVGAGIFLKLPFTAYPLLRHFAHRIMRMYASTYQCEQLLCIKKSIKSNHRTHIINDNQLAELK